MPSFLACLSLGFSFHFLLLCAHTCLRGKPGSWSASPLLLKKNYTDVPCDTVIYPMLSPLADTSIRWVFGLAETEDEPR